VGASRQGDTTKTTERCSKGDQLRQEMEKKGRSWTNNSLRRKSGGGAGGTKDSETMGQHVPGGNGQVELKKWPKNPTHSGGEEGFMTTRSRTLQASRGEAQWGLQNVGKFLWIKKKSGGKGVVRGGKRPIERNKSFPGGNQVGATPLQGGKRGHRLLSRVLFWGSLAKGCKDRQLRSEVHLGGKRGGGAK